MIQFSPAKVSWSGAALRAVALLLLTFCGVSSARAQFTVDPPQVNLDVSLGTNPEPVSFTVTNPHGNDRPLLVTSSNPSAFLHSNEVLIVPAGGSIQFPVSFELSGYGAGFYEANLRFTELLTARPARDGDLETIVSFFVKVTATGPPSVPDLYYEASPLRVTTEGIVMLSGNYCGLGCFQPSGTEPFAYQWTFSNDGVSYGALTESTPLNEYELASVSPADAGYYRVVVSNDFGTTVSLPLRLEVFSAPEILQGPEDLQAPEGIASQLVFSVIGSAPMAFDWYKIPGVGLPGVLVEDSDFISGSETAALTFLDPKVAIEGLYYCVAGNEAGEVTSRTASVTVLAAPFIEDQPQTIEVFEGEVANFHITAISSTELFYLWESSANGSTWGTVVDSAVFSGQGTAHLSISSAKAAQALRYRCTVENSTAPVVSDVAQLIVVPQPARLELNPETIDHYVVSGSAFAPSGLEISNVGVAALTFSFAAPTESFLGAANPANGSVAGGARRSISIPFPNGALAAGVYETELSLSTNAYNSGSVTIPIRLTVVAPFTVTTLEDSGARSLREIIGVANTTAGAQTIGFAVTGEIVLKSALPALTDVAGTTIDGDGLVALDGRMLRGRENGLELRSANNTITGLTVVNFPANGILVTGAGATGNRIVMCNIGTDREADLGNREAGIRLDGSSSATTVGGSSAQANVVSGNAFSAITIGTSNNNIIGGNTMGPKLDKPGFVGNGGHGIHLLQVFTGDVTIGGTAFFDSNLIAGNKFYPESIDVLAGRTVELTALTAGTDLNAFAWQRGTTPVGSTNKLVLTNVQNANEGLYSCVITNQAGTVTSKETFLNVLSASEFLAKELLPRYAALDVNGDGFLSFTELSAAAREALSLASGRSRNVTQAEFEQLDTNNDGFVSVEEMLNGSSLEVADVRYVLSPESAAYAETNIDAGATPEEVFYIDNLDTSPLDMITTPTLTGLGAADFVVTADSGPNVIPELGFREMKITFNPSALNERVAYLEVRTDDFTLPYFPLPLIGSGFIPTPNLIQSLLKTGGPDRPAQEVDVNEDGVLDAADVSTNKTNNH